MIYMNNIFISMFGFIFLIAVLNMPLMGNPMDGMVMHGDATINEVGNTMHVEQHRDKTIIDWNSFSIESHTASCTLEHDFHNNKQVD